MLNGEKPQRAAILPDGTPTAKFHSEKIETLDLVVDADGRKWVSHVSAFFECAPAEEVERRLHSEVCVTRVEVAVG